MELLCSVLMLMLCVEKVVSLAEYNTYDLETFTPCIDDREKASIIINPWKAAILKVGYLFDDDGSPASHKIHECKVTVNTKEDFGLAAVIEEMKITGTQDKHTNGWVCHGDYVKLSTSGPSFWSKLISSLPFGLFKSKSTEELCGTRKKRQLFSEIGSSANILSTLANNLEVLFHQRQSRDYPVNNTFTIVITAFKHTKDEACKGKFKCTGNDNYCIDPSYVCDNHFNCAFPSGGGDELQCAVKAVYHPIFSTTTTIITVLAGIVGAGLVVCCLFTIIMKAKSRNDTPSGTPVPPVGHTPAGAAPNLQRQHTLPPYEAVVMSDASQNWKSSTLPSPEVGEYPPSYHMLFPEGPPKDLQTETAHTHEETNSLVNNPSAPSAPPAPLVPPAP
ncbi:hypothetical protein OTU49_001346 [Cherax quadricarinatus]|uniref:CUB domain-containing protein n=1 Tax=Cherax quadricarinatus TaxID=27406 RepID=A0AAW0XFG5_CHEQU